MDTWCSQIGQGKTSVHSAVSVAKDVVEETHCRGKISSFASLGGESETHFSNEEKDLHRWSSKAEALRCVEPYDVILPLYNRRTQTVEQTVVQMLLPYEMSASIWRAGKKQQDLSLFGPAGREGLRQWWQQCREFNYWARAHPHIQENMSSSG